MRGLPVVSLSVVILLCAAPAARADVVSLNADADTTIYESIAGNLANGAGTAMFAGRNSGTVNSKRRALLHFDASTIPAGAVLTAATLRLYDSAANVDPAIVSVHALSAGWGEGTAVATGGQGGGGPAGPGDATWLHRNYPGTLWNAAGGDFNTIPSAAATVIDPGFYEWSSSRLLDDISVFYSNPAVNFGWILVGDESVTSSAKRFATREELEPDTQPVLTVVYQVPEPAGAALMALGIAALATQRRAPTLRPRPQRPDWQKIS